MVLTQKERAERFDALELAIRLEIELLEKELDKPYTYEPEKVLSVLEYGRRAQIQHEIETLKRWT